MDLNAKSGFGRSTVKQAFSNPNVSDVIENESSGTTDKIQGTNVVRFLIPRREQKVAVGKNATHRASNF